MPLYIMSAAIILESRHAYRLPYMRWIHYSLYLEIHMSQLYFLAFGLLSSTFLIFFETFASSRSLRTGNDNVYDVSILWQHNLLHGLCCQ